MVKQLFDDDERNREREVDLQDMAIIRTPEDQIEHDHGITNYDFNAYVSRKIGYRRKIKDSRDAQCEAITYSVGKSDAASIIIVYFNEEPHVLIRMINSILDRTPDHLIHEILLIDDCSDLEERKPEMIVEYKQQYWSDKIRLLKTSKNEGLIRAKIFGAHKATGSNLVFLDSHCEVNIKWLEPLLERIKLDHKKVVCPIIDIIKSDTFEYVTSPICTGGFDFNLNFKWDYPVRSYLEKAENRIKELKSPTMAGGLFG
uniref:Glyco_trans_2-like domain-containing protein n=1 Tax=Rhabditophanes sp. KR3021 TaxID=114890 RepID=A0AC35U4B0_9BILA